MALPGAVFERRRIWIDAPPQPPARSGAKQPEVADWFYTPSWKRAAAAPAPPPRVERWLLIADQRGLADALAARLRAAGLS